MSDSYLAQWIAKIDTGHVITKDDMATLARIRMALDNADKHHRQARETQAVLAALRDPSEVVARSAIQRFTGFDSEPPPEYIMSSRNAIRAAVVAAEKEVQGE